jgi:flagellar biosynthesis/type III secretory pathway protein FliH
MASLSDRLRAEGMEKGLEQGIEKGMEKGLHDGVEGTLRKLVHLKFGAIPAWADEQMKEATDEQLDRWVTGILEAESLESLLGER